MLLSSTPRQVTTDQQRDESEPLFHAYPQTTDAKTIARILKRARKVNARESRQQSKGDRAARNSVLAQALGKALGHHGRTKTGCASIRPTALETGGRAFHFAHSTITRGGSARIGTVTKAARASNASAGTHQRRHPRHRRQRRPHDA